MSKITFLSKNIQNLVKFGDYNFGEFSKIAKIRQNYIPAKNKNNTSNTLGICSENFIVNR